MKPKPHAVLRFWRSPLFFPQIRTTLVLALPLMLGELSGMLMGVAGVMMAGHLGETELAASGVASVVFAISMLLIWGGVRMVPTPVAEAHETRDAVRVRTLLFAALLLSVFFWLVAGSMMGLGIANFHLLKQDPAVSLLAVDYLKMIWFSLPALILFAVLVNFADALGYVRITMYIAFGGLALDVLLNWLLIFGHCGFPKMGIRAIALNTGITHAIMVLVLGLLLWRHSGLAYIQQAKTRFEEVWSQALTFFRLGVPSALQIMVEFAAFGIGTIIIGQISKTEQAAHQIAINLISVTYVTIMGVSTAGMIRVGQALAYDSRVRVWMAGLSALALALLFMLLPTVAFLTLPGAIVACYTEEADVTRIAVSLLFFAGLFQFFDAAQATGVSLLRSLNDVLRPSVISLLAFWVIGVPLGYWLAVHQGWNARGIWVGYLVALIIQAVLFLQRFFVLLKERPMASFKT